MSTIFRHALALFLSVSVFSCTALFGQWPANIKDVPLERVSITEGYWDSQRQVWQQTTIRDCLDKFERDGAFENFQRVIDGRRSGHQGEPWFDGLVLEVIRAASDFFRSHPDPGLRARIDAYVELICDAAEKDPHCFLSTYTQLETPDRRWGRNGGSLRFQHDVYNAGCLIETGVHDYEATGNTRLLGVAAKLATHMAQSFGPPPKQNVVPGHALPEEALVKLYRVFQSHPELSQQIGQDIDAASFLSLAEFFVEGRGHHEGRTSFGSYAQDDIPVLQQETIEGHAVRATLLCAGLAAVAKTRPSETYFDAAERQWQNMTGRRMYVTGGVGAIAHDERFGDDYELPNDGYLETCAAVGAAFFHHNMHQVSPQGKFIDEFERVLYNAILSGVSLSGNRYLYESPLTANASRRRWDWHPCPCCPPMFLKLMGALPGYIYSESDDAIYVNLFIPSSASLSTATGTVQLRQQTEYPFDSSVKIHVSPEQASGLETALMLRVPGWCNGFEIEVNGQVIADPVVEDGYVKLSRRWNEEDVVDVQFSMPAKFVSSHPNVKSNLGRVAVQKGPLVYCFEDTDNQNQLNSAYLSPQANIVVVRRPDLLGGMDTVVIKAKRRIETQSDAELYRESNSSAEGEPIQLIGIPFFAHSNREPTARKVWLPTTITLAEPASQPSVASRASWSASHCFSGDTIQSINDQLGVAASDDQSIPRFTWWDHRGTKEWLQCDLAEPTRLSEVRVYWWDERRIEQHCRVPASWRVLHRRDGQWLPLGEPGSGPTEMDRFNSIRFPATTIESLRIEVELQPEWSGGVLEIQLH